MHLPPAATGLANLRRHAQPPPRAGPARFPGRLLARRRRDFAPAAARRGGRGRGGRREARLPVERHSQHDQGGRQRRRRGRRRRGRRPVPGHGELRPSHRRGPRRPGRLAVRDRRLGPGGPSDRRAAPALRRRPAAGGDRGHPRAAGPAGLGPLRGRPGDPHRPRRGAARGLQDGPGPGREPLRARRGDRPLLLRRARRAVERRGPLLGRAPRVGDARGVLGGALGRRRPSGRGERHPAADRARARRPRAAERVPPRSGADHLGAGGRPAQGAQARPIGQPDRGRHARGERRSPSPATRGATSAGG